MTETCAKCGHDEESHRLKGRIVCRKFTPQNHSPQENHGGDAVNNHEDTQTLSDKIFSNFWIHTPKDSKMVKNVILAEDVREKVKELKEVGLKKTLYPKYLMLTKDDLDKIFGKELSE